MYRFMEVWQDTCDHQRRNLKMSQAELSIHRRNNGNKKKTAASIFGSKYTTTANIYNEGIFPVCPSHNLTVLIIPDGFSQVCT
jgi:hypothetical protein